MEVEELKILCLNVQCVILKASKNKKSTKKYLTFLRECDKIMMLIFLDSSMVEHTAVNRGVVGSSPTRGVWLLGQAVKTSPFHGGNTGSIPVGVIQKKNLLKMDL